MILLDTQTLIWHDVQDRRLGAHARSMIHYNRIIVATAARLNAVLITSDEQIMRWTGPVDRHYAYD